MNLKIALLGATAFGLLIATGAYAAGGNKAYLSQDGNANSASITQNAAATTGNQAGTSSDNATQTGSNNSLTILQDGNNGQIGVATGTTYYLNPDHPNFPGQFDITYQGVNQASSGSGSNTANLTQHGTGSVIGDLQQSANATAGGNSVTTTQTDANAINHITQYQDADANATNVATLTETGSGNQIDRVDQRARGAAGANSITVNISGTGNGADNFDGTGPFYTSRGWDAGGSPSALIQNNLGGGPYGYTYGGPIGGNIINLAITGNDNQFGMTQKGTDNSAGTVTISGSSNSFGSYQAGTGNVINAGTIAGDSNQVGINQNGATNTATVTVLAAGSNGNELHLRQQGTSNDATVSITGSYNGAGMFAPGGVAGTLVSGTHGWLSDGMVIQGGTLSSATNHANLTIYGDSNEFAVAQLGSNNTFVGNIGSSSSSSPNNEAAVIQNGDWNTTSVTQLGTGGNVAAVNQ